MEVPRHWRLKKQRYAMIGETCPSCKAPVFPPRPVCPYCGGDARAELAVHKHEPALAMAEHMQPAGR